MRQKMKKSQAALEFLMTYGWAFLVILVMIGALAYFGVLNPKKLLPEKCTVPAGFTCDEYSIKSSGANTDVTIILRNTQGSPIVITDYNISGSMGSAVGNLSGALVGVGENITMTKQITGQSKAGDKLGMNFKVTWKEQGKTLDKVLDGDIFATVQ